MKLKELRYSLAVFAVSFIVYLMTLCPTIYAGDSGDFITAAYTLGIAHPAGYPIYTIIGKVFTLIPYGNIAFRMNLMNAFFTSLAVAVVYSTVVLLTKSRISGVGASLMLAFSYTIWAQAVLSEAYSLNGFFCSVLVYLVVLWYKTKRDRILYYLAFAYGLALTNHVSLAFLLPAFIYLLWKSSKKGFGWDTVKKTALSFIAGLIVYLYIPLRASMKPEHNWGDPETLDRFLIHVTAYVHRHSHVFVLDAGRSASRFVGLILLYMRQFSLSGATALFGLFYIGDNILLGFTALVVLLDSFYTMFLNVVSFEATAFGMPSYIIFSIWAGFGIKRIVQLIDKKTKDASLRKYAGPAFVAILVLVPLAFNFRDNNQSANRIAYYYGMDLLNTVENNSVIFAEGDNEVFILRYLLVAEKVRPDVVMYDMNGFLSQQLYGVDYPWLPDAEHNEREDQVEYEVIKSGRPVYYTSRRNMRNMPGYGIAQTGLLYRVFPEDETLPERDYWSGYDTTGFDDESIYKDYLTRALIAAYHTRRGIAYYAEGYSNNAVSEFEKASSIGADIPDVHGNLGKIYLDWSMYGKAIAEYNASISLDPNNARAHNNLGYAYVSSGDYKNAIAEYVNALRIDPYYSTARYNLAGILFERKEYDNALQEYMFITNYDPNYAAPYKNIGTIYYYEGKYSLASEYWGKFIAMKPDDVDAGILRNKIHEIGVANGT
jgi:tetratricopeptide (TPR) repeat protein